MFIFLMALITDEENKTKFENIYYQYRDLMLYIAYNILNDYSLAEDAVQDAFVRIIKNIDKIGEIDCHKTKGFVVIVIENVAKTMYVKNKQNLIEPEICGCFSQDFSEIENNELVEKILNLPERYSTVLNLHYLYDYSYREIAKILSANESTVRKWVQRGLVLLEKELTDWRND